MHRKVGNGASAPNGGARPASLGDAALRYAARGWAVFPLRPRAKVPLIPKAEGGNGVHDATTDPATVARWWRGRPDANVGLAAGASFWVLDVDCLGWEAQEPDGAASFAALVEEFGPLPPTIAQLTGGGGWQFLFAPDPRVRNEVRLLPGLDTRGAGGYIVAPPSVHPEGPTYRWKRGAWPEALPLARAPEWLVQLAEPVKVRSPEQVRHRVPIGDLDRYGAAALEGACGTIARAPVGRQCDTLDRQSYGIGQLVAGGVIPPDLARAAIVDAGCRMQNAAGRRPWTRDGVARRIERAFRKAATAPRAPGAR